jgi:hypothetical protein
MRVVLIGGAIEVAVALPAALCEVRKGRDEPSAYHSFKRHSGEFYVLTFRKTPYRYQENQFGTNSRIATAHEQGTWSVPQQLEDLLASDL